MIDGDYISTIEELTRKTDNEILLLMVKKTLVFSEENNNRYQYICYNNIYYNLSHNPSLFNRLQKINKKYKRKIKISNILQN